MSESVPFVQDVDVTDPPSVTESASTEAWDLPQTEDEDDMEEGAWVPPVPPTSV